MSSGQSKRDSHLGVVIGIVGLVIAVSALVFTLTTKGSKGDQGKRGTQGPSIEPGIVAAWPLGSKTPESWLVCDGAIINQKDYPKLYQAMEKVEFPYNQGDEGQGNCRIPDYRGYFLRGLDDPDGDGQRLAAGRDKDSGRDFKQPQSGSTQMPSESFKVKIDGKGNGVERIFVTKEFVFETGNGESAVQTGKEISTFEITGGDPETRPINMPVNWVIYAGKDGAAQ